MKHKKISWRYTRLFFILFILAEFLVINIIASLFLAVVDNYFPVIHKIPLVIWLIVISAILGSAITAVLVHFFFKPMVRLGEAMRQVALGNYDVRLEQKHFFPEIRQINRDFNAMAQELGSTEILKTEFISNVSHEFKTPINAIEGYATLLQDCQQQEEQDTYIGKILFNTRRLSKLVGNILLLSKVDNQGIHPHVTTYRLDEQIRQSIVSLEPRWMEKENDFDVELESIQYTGNENLLNHVWNNLIENAIKYGPKGGLITLRLFQRENKIIFTISDEGPGIPLEAQQHVFDRFYQADSSRKTEGNGLGLSLVRQILAHSDGTVQVENLPEKGSQFTVTLRSESI